MAHIYKRGKTWYFVCEGGTHSDGSRKQISKGGFRLKKDAELAAGNIEREINEGTYVSLPDTTFTEFANEWLKRYGTQVKPPTKRIRKNEMEHVGKTFGGRIMHSIKKREYQDFLYDLLEKGYAENTISGIHGTARMIFKDAKALDVIREDITQYVRPPKRLETLADVEKADDIPKYLEKEDLSTFLRLAHDAGLYQDYTLFLLLSYTGIRVGELCALKWSDVDTTEHTISITKTYYNPTNNIKKYELGLPKTKSSRRCIHVSEKVIKELEVHRARQRKEEMKNKNVWHNKEFVFTSEKFPGYPVYAKLVGIRMSRILKIGGLPEELTPHSLRHTHTSLLAEAGVGLEEIMERLGHVDDDTTRKVYLHVTKEMKKEAAHKFDVLMDSL